MAKGLIERRMSRRTFGAAGTGPIVGVLSLFFFAAGCVGADPVKPEPYNLSQAQRVISVGFGHVNNRYIDDISLRQVAVNSLKGVAKLEPALEVRDGEGAIEPAYKGEAIGRFSRPDQDTAQGWAELVAGAIEAARARSQLLAGQTTEDILQAVFDSTLAALDPFSRYASAREAEDNRAARDGFGGIGVTLRMEATDAVIQSVVAGGPAARAGVQTDDRITHVDDKEIAGWDQRDLIRAIRGPVGANVVLKMTRAGAQGPVAATIGREHIITPTVVAERRNDTLVLRVTGFNQDTSQSIVRALSAARADAARPIKGVVLDMRNNPGGLLDQAVQTADIFLDKGEISATRGRHPNSRQRFDAAARDLADGLPLVVLINGASASGAEVAAAALQDLGRAVLVGTNSYGKGTVQTVLRLPNNGEMTLTWSRLLAPSGYILHGLGVMPSVCTHGGGQIADASRIVAELKSGDAGAAAALPAWRSNTVPNGAQVAELRQQCKSDNRSPDVDLAVADALIAEPQLYNSALARSTPSIAGR